MRLLLILIVFVIGSCSIAEPPGYRMSGNYDAQIEGYHGYFNLNVDLIDDNFIAIEAPFDNYAWSIVEAEFILIHSNSYAIEIPYQSLGAGVFIWGSGFYENDFLELSYSMQFGNEQYYYHLNGWQQF